MSTATAYPLTWPQQFPRTQYPTHGSFKTELRNAIHNVPDSLRLFGADSGKKMESVIISPNVTLGVSGSKDPGVAVWFTWDGLQLCIPVDRYDSVQSNLQAIHHILEARRVELRHGTLALVRATFTGFKALPTPPEESWWVVLRCNRDSPRSSVEFCYKNRRSETHPDKGGSTIEFDHVQRAWEQAQREIGAQP